MAADIIPLVELFGAIRGLRQASGKRYALAAILALACAAMVCGYHSYSAIAEWAAITGSSLSAHWVLRTARRLLPAPCIGFSATWIARSSKAS